MGIQTRVGRFALIVVLLFVPPLLSGCDTCGEPGQPACPICVANARQACQCPGTSCPGVQVCATDGMSLSECSCAPGYLGIEIRGATLAPFKSDQSQWDALVPVSTEVATGLLTALNASNAYAAVLTYLANATIAVLTKPDPYGGAKLFYGGQWDTQTQLPLGIRGSEPMDTFTPQFQGPPGWRCVPDVDDLRLNVALWDEDIGASQNDDPIGSPDINHAKLLEALDSQQAYQVRVAEQTNNQLLFVTLSVTRN